MDASLTLRRVGIRRRSDDDVLTLAFDGDPVAFAEVYRRYHKPIYGYCLARLWIRKLLPMRPKRSSSVS